MVLMLFGLWLAAEKWTHRRHSPTDGGNRSGEGSGKFTGEISRRALGVVVVTGGRYVGQLPGAFVPAFQPCHDPRRDESDQSTHTHGGETLVTQARNLALGTSEEFCHVAGRPKRGNGVFVKNGCGGHTLAFGVKNQGGKWAFPRGKGGLPGRKFFGMDENLLD